MKHTRSPLPPPGKHDGGAQSRVCIHLILTDTHTVGAGLSVGAGLIKVARVDPEPGSDQVWSLFMVFISDRVLGFW